MSDQEKNYTSQSIKVLEGLEGVRKRPAMYIGGVDIAGLHHLAYEVVDNSVDEALAGHCNKIDIILYEDGSCSVEDNGRGIPADIHESEGVSAAQVVLTKLHAGGKFNKDSYKFSGGLHGVGVSVVNALSKKLEIVICRDGKKYQQFYEIGTPVAPLKEIGESKSRGTFIKFLPDDTIFTTTQFKFDILAARFRELAFLNKGLTIRIQSFLENQDQTFFFEGGIISFIEHINKNKNPLFPNVISMSKEDEQYVLDFAFQYNESYQEQTFSFVNNIRTKEGGTHEAGFKSALTKISNKFAQTLNMNKNEAFSSDDVREGLVCVLSIKVPEPQFEGQTKNKLGNAEVKGIVDSWIYAFLDRFFEENPALLKIILLKAQQAQQARLAAKKARDLTRKKNIFETSVLPGKLADCSESDPTKTEIYIVEGDSAGGSAKQGRDRFTQAILPIRGKILNVEKTSIARALGNNEIKDLITAIGAGVGESDFNVEKVRYHKIVIMTDADIDGAHIRMLLLTFFYRYMKPLIEKGYLYIAQPPLYKAKVGKSESYLKDEDQFKEFLFEWAGENTAISENGTTLEQPAVKELLSNLKKYDQELNRQSSTLTFPARWLHQIVSLVTKSQENISKDNLDVENFILQLTSNLQGVEVSIEKEHQLDKDEVFVKFRKEQNKDYFLFHLDAIFSNNFKELCQLFNKISSKELSSWEILSSSKQKKESASDLLELAAKIIKLGKSLMTLQRYKGLGEMDADQLWETTMDPKNRSFLQVTIDDGIAADQIFTELMGDAVEPRRQYIENNAQFVRNLDVYNF